MSQIGQIFEFLQKLVIWWVTIMPWEEAVHVRMGKKIRILDGGLHLRIPFLDRVYVQTTRMRIVQMPPQTVTTRDGKTITMIMNMGYKIVDIYKLYSTLYHADQTLCNMMQGIVAGEIYKRNLEECIPSELEALVAKGLESNDYGLEFQYMKITGFAVVKTYRLIQDGHWLPDGLITDKPKA